MGASRDFNGTGQRVEFGTAATFEDDSEMTVMCWINPDDLTNNQSWYSKWLSTSKPFFITLESQRLYLSLGPADDSTQRAWGSDLALSTYTSTGNWAHIAVTNSLTTTTGSIVCVNGVEIPSRLGFNNSSDTKIYSNSAPYNMGSLDGSIYNSNARICHGEIFNTRLTSDQINELQYQPFAFISKSYIPMYGADSPELEFGNGLTGTVIGATESFDGPPVFLLGGQ